MSQQSLYLLLGSLDDETVRTECLPLPMTEPAIRQALQTALEIGGRSCGAVVPVVSEGPPTGFMVAAVAWAAAQGRIQPFEAFEMAPGDDLEPILAAVTAIQAAEELEASDGRGCGPKPGG